MGSLANTFWVNLRTFSVRFVANIALLQLSSCRRVIKNAACSPRRSLMRPARQQPARRAVRKIPYTFLEHVRKLLGPRARRACHATMHLVDVATRMQLASTGQVAACVPFLYQKKQKMAACVRS